MSSDKVRSDEVSSRNVSGKNNYYISWEDYFMATSVLASLRSKDPATQVGACVVNDENKIVGVGYNGFPKGCSDDEFPWCKKQESPNDNKHLYVCHAEVNALLNRNCCNTKGCRMYVTIFPCNDCTKFIIQSGIKEIIYLNFSEKFNFEATKKMLEAANITYRKFESKRSEIKITLDDINQTSIQESTCKKRRIRPEVKQTEM